MPASMEGMQDMPAHDIYKPHGAFLGHVVPVRPFTATEGGVKIIA
jgi:hypothetical protein